jgi:hypothetical protein
MKHRLPIAAATVFLLAGSVVKLSAQHEHGGVASPQVAGTSPKMKTNADHVFKVGKKGEITLSAETHVGDVVLRPGKYTLQHRVDGPDHFLHFAAQSGKNASADVKCTLKPLEGKVSSTLVRLQNMGTSMRLVQVLIGGENVAHVL